MDNSHKVLFVCLPDSPLKPLAWIHNQQSGNNSPPVKAKDIFFFRVLKAHSHCVLFIATVILLIATNGLHRTQ